MRKVSLFLLICLCLVLPVSAQEFQGEDVGEVVSDVLVVDDEPAGSPQDAADPASDVVPVEDSPVSVEPDNVLSGVVGDGESVVGSGDSVAISGDNVGRDGEREVEGDEVVFPEGPYAVYFVEPPEVEGAEIAPFSAMGAAYAGTISTAVYEYFRDITASLPWGDHYVFFRRDAYTYILAYGPDLTLTGTTFSAPRVSIVQYYSYSNNSNNGISRFTDTNFSVSSGYGNVYSDLGVYPRMFEGVTRREFQALSVLVVVFFLVDFVRRLFVRRGG